ncbi:MAG TPA: hypothetical protein VJB14_01305 [Planctomycetota bacterium]|nr:hypothetical protein [Planctomycetota bacterium]
MAKPYRGSPILELRRAQEHMKDIAAVLESLKRQFGEEGIVFAVIGATAVGRHGHFRHTEDLDILTTPEGLARIHERFAGRGINPRAAGLRKKLIESEHQVPIDVITSGEKAGGEGSPIVYPDPGGPGFVEFEGVRYPTLERLIEFKLASHMWGHRLHDAGDVQRLIQANGLGESFVASLHPDLRPKFLEILDLARREKDIE